MRRIKKRTEPASLSEWRANHQAAPESAGINFGYSILGQDKAVREELQASLIAEQGGLCAYTGRRIDSGSCHIEHLIPQSHCALGQGKDVAYDNMVACWPAPNTSQPVGHGAVPKGDWPAPDEAHLFVSPLNAGCEERFRFNLRGEISASRDEDRAARETIQHLKLDDRLLTSMRHKEIEAVLGKNRNLGLKDARRRLNRLAEDEAALAEGNNPELNPFCFALKQALNTHINSVENARRQRSQSTRSSSDR